MKKHYDLNADYQPASFSFKEKKKVKEIIDIYPKGRQQSAVMPLLDLAQRQMAKNGLKADPPYGGWIPRAAMDEIADILNMPEIKVYEVATFYSMYNMAPVGKYLVQFCGTTPCHLCGSQNIMDAVEKRLGIKIGQSTDDGLFSLMEVECLGACVNAPMVQINDDYFEDLTADNIVQIIDDLEAGKKVSVGSQTGRKCSMSACGATTLADQAKKCGVS